MLFQFPADACCSDKATTVYASTDEVNFGDPRHSLHGDNRLPRTRCSYSTQHLLELGLSMKGAEHLGSTEFAYSILLLSLLFSLGHRAFQAHEWSARHSSTFGGHVPAGDTHEMGVY